MDNKKQIKFNLLKLFIIIFLIWIPIPIHADGIYPNGIKVDGTIGNAGKIDLSGPNYEIKADYGKQAGGNLFHSFQQFNIHSNESATFSGPASVQSIISRVTGGSASWIDGKLGSTIPNANVYLLNPSGVMFGANASLDLSGSFHVSTADYLLLGKADRFYAIPAANEVLSVASPVSFGFLTNNPAKISMDGGTLEVKEGKSISLIGGDIDLHKSTLKAPGGTIRLGDNGNITLSEKSVVDVSGTGGGSIFIRGGQFAAKDSTIQSNTLGDNDAGAIDIQANSVLLSDGARIISKTEAAGKGSDINIRSNESVTVSGENSDLISSSISASSGEGLSFENIGNCGNLLIQAKDISVKDGASFSVNTYGAGKGGDIILQASESVAFTGKGSNGSSFIKAVTYSDSKSGGDAGTLSIEAKNISFKDAAYLNLLTQGGGKGGNVTVKASESVIFSNESNIDVSSYSKAEWGGDAGNFSIEARNISFTDGSAFNTSTRGAGRGGDVSLKASESVIFSGGSIGSVNTLQTRSTTFAGDGGNISIDAQNIVFENAAVITTSTFGKGNAGDIDIHAAEQIRFTGLNKYNASSGLRAIVYGTGSGNGGDITIDAKDVLLTDGAQISTTTRGPGKGGNITVKTSAIFTASGSGGPDLAGGIKSQSIAGTKGITVNNGGNVLLETQELILKDGAQVACNTEAVAGAQSGMAGNVSIKAGNTVRLSGSGSGIYTGANAVSDGKTGNAGSISLVTNSLIIEKDAVIDSGTTGNAADGGEVYLSAKSLTISGQGKISTSSAGKGIAGDISLNLNQLMMKEKSSVSSASESYDVGGNAGTISINALDSITLINGSLTTDANAAGGGKINIHAGNVIYLLNGQITSNVKMGEGNGGDISIDPRFVILNHSSITANADEGDGGAIFIHTDNYLKSADSKVTAKSRRGNDGTVKIVTPELNIASGLMILPSGFLDATQWIKTPCAARSAEKVSQFVITGRDAVPTAMYDLQAGKFFWLDDEKDSK